MIERCTGITREYIAEFVARCMNNPAGFEPYMPNDGDNSFWTVDAANDWKLQFYNNDIFDICNRYHKGKAQHSIEYWVAYRLGVKVL